VPHVPQLPGSLCVLTQVPPQLVSPCWQVSWQVPLMHTWPAGQDTPQLPQLLLSEVVSTHLPLQFTSPAWQLSVHAPLTQT